MKTARILLVFALPGLVCAAIAGCGGAQADAIDPLPDVALVKGIREAVSTSQDGSQDGAPVAADSWGTLTGRFVFDGDPPQLGSINPDKDPAICGKEAPIPVERLVVDGSGGVANVFVYVTTKAAKLPIHSSYDSLSGAELTIDNKNCRFSPHALAFWTKNKLVGVNQDAVTHNIKVDLPGERIIDQPVPAPKEGQPGRSGQITVNKVQRLPVPVSCNFHGWMRGYILPRDNPYFAVSAADGSFRIENLPAGIELEFQFWHEAQADALPIPNAKRGKWKVKLAEGDTNLGEIHLSAANFKL